ncbi:MAG: GDP-mannose 4,6-dehydratase [Patescibacteria group bacterium]|nr:GDP-mannose 4,6-dehydratase [Patescibacteria group bacterium]MDD4610838.1 GDP-mannose 4,6-dehydratase [Patescibacteria group bacterium]
MVKQAIFDKKNVLVTGGAGFIGSHLCDELVKNSKVICLDNYLTGDEKNIDHLLADPNFEFVRHNVAEPIDLEKVPGLEKFKIRFQGVQEIYHLACPTSPKNFEDNRLASLLANSYGMKNVLDLAVKYKAKLVHFSSAVIYGPRRANNPRIKEDDLGLVNILSDRSCYDEGKRFAETMVKNYREIYHLDAKIMRIFRTYGPRMKLNDNQMVPDFVRDALDNNDLVIYGNKDFSSSFCYIGDCVDAALRLMDSDLFGPYNIGSDVDINISEVGQKIIDLIGSKSKITYDQEHLFMTPLCLPDITRVRDELGWLPVTNLDKGLEKTIADLRASKGLRGIGSSF